jgi:Domain of unknown function (DUF4406)
MQRVYIAGPMSNLPQFNFPAFYEAAAALRAAGFDVVSPAEMDADLGLDKAALASTDGNVEAISVTWGDLLARDVKLIADGGIEGIVFLPNWQKSRGARLEATVGLIQKNFSFFYYTKDGAVPMSPSKVALELYYANNADIYAARKAKAAA